VPAAAVIPAPIAYIKVVAVKASVVEFRNASIYIMLFQRMECLRFLFVDLSINTVTLSKLECSKQAFACTTQHRITR
jgi:hypothetical protein